jgi:inorganic pyrophosphatase
MPSSRHLAAATRSSNTFETRCFILAKPLMAGLTTPTIGGFIPSTRAEDGDPLDAGHSRRRHLPGLGYEVQAIGILKVVQKHDGRTERNDRLFVVPDRSPFEGNLQDIRRLPRSAIRELEKIFEATNALEAKELTFRGSHGSRRAIKAANRNRPSLSSPIGPTSSSWGPTSSSWGPTSTSWGPSFPSCGPWKGRSRLPACGS